MPTDNGFAHEQHEAWFTGVTEEDKLVVHHLPIGHRYLLLMAAYLKYALVHCEMTVGERLQILEGLNGLVADHTGCGISREALAAVDPACGTAVKMINEAKNNDDSPGHVKAAEMLTDCEIFWHFIRLNPSILEAAKFSGWRG